MKKLPFNFDVRCQAGDDPAEISIRGIIGLRMNPDWSITDVETEVLNELAQIPAGKKINVRINSKGGDHGMSLGIYNALVRRQPDVTTYNEGYCCSGASLVLCAGARVVCPAASVTMIHMAACADYGNADDKLKVADFLKVCDETQVAVYSKRMGKSKEDTLALLKAETFMSGDKAKELGMCDEASGETEPEQELDDAEARQELEVISAFKNPPQILQDLRSRLSVRAQATATPPRPPTPNPQPKTKSMKNIITALVAAGFSIPADADENQILPHIQTLISERSNFQVEITKHLDARKTRVTALLDAAVTEKVIAETRKTGLLAIGTASANGETEVTAQIADLRAAHAAKAPRGAPPARRPGEADPADVDGQIEGLVEQMDGKDTTAEQRGALAMNSLKLRGLDGLFKKQTAEPTTRN
jgi:ATP-dependent protease ClpP protease subunit